MDNKDDRLDENPIDTNDGMDESAVEAFDMINDKSTKENQASFNDNGNRATTGEHETEKEIQKSTRTTFQEQQEGEGESDENDKKKEGNNDISYAIDGTSNYEEKEYIIMKEIRHEPDKEEDPQDFIPKRSHGYNSQTIQQDQKETDTLKNAEDYSSDERNDEICEIEDEWATKLQEIWDQFGRERRQQKTRENEFRGTNDNNQDKTSCTSENIERAVTMTIKLMTSQVDSLTDLGLMAYHGWERTQRQLVVVKATLDAKEQELVRLREAEQKSQESIKNLFRAVETSKEQTRNATQATLKESKLRYELHEMTQNRDNIVAEQHETKRKLSLVQEDLRHTKSKLAKVTQEKIQLERDQRATLSLAKSLEQGSGSNNSNHQADTDYYKRKITELNGHIQGMNSVVSEKNRQIDDLRRYMERSMSQNRLASFRAESSSSLSLSRSSSNTKINRKKSSFSMKK